MADLVDVENELVQLIASTIYPNGTSQASVTGVPTTIYVGWPTASNLDADLAALAIGGGKMHVTVFPLDAERNTTRYPRAWQQVQAPAVTLTLTQAGQQVTVGGTVSTPQNVVLMVGYKPYVYAVQATDTLASIAASVAALISGATAAGAVITVPNSLLITAARVGAAGTNIMEVRRQERVFQITVWADTPAHRDAAAQAIDVALAQMEFITLADQTAARLIYRGSFVDDMVQKANLYRRDLRYSVEFATTVTETDTQITQTQLNTSAAVAGVLPYQPVATTYD